MNKSKNILSITQRIVERSRQTREDYLQRVSDAHSKDRVRATLSCGNLAHAMATCNTADKKRIAGEVVPNLGIISSYNDMLSAHQPYGDYPDQIKKVSRASGATAQVAGAVPAMCDGVTQGQPGMELSLFSRDIIAMSTAISLSQNVFDGALYLGVCDKIVPGLVIGALSFGHLPSVFLPAGPMPSGQSNTEKAKVRQAYVSGKVGRKELLASESASYHSVGTCTFYGTANSNQLLMEIMGLHIPGSSFIPPNTPLREAITAAAVEILIAQLNGDRETVPIADIISEKTIVNGLIGLVATGGSTNQAIHLVAMAKAAGIIIDWQDLAEISDAVPLLTRIYPNGKADINDFQNAGGMAFLMQQLSQTGYLHQDVKTVMGEGLDDYYKMPELIENSEATLYHSDPALASSGNVVSWKNQIFESLDETVLRPEQNAFNSEGGLKLLTGNIGRSIIKVSAVAKEHQIIEAPAVVFNSQEEMVESYQAGDLEKDFVAVIRFQGPKANGMPELHQLTPILGVQQEKGFKVALVTDGRMSGASGKIPAAIHLVPEACNGGIIAKINNGDVIRLDAVQSELKLLIPDKEIETREVATIETDDCTGMGRELFATFRQNVNSAEQGATIF